MSFDYILWSREMRQRCERALDGALRFGAPVPSRLTDAMRYSTLGGGKRIRALLVYAAQQTTDAPVDALDYAASAVEMIHAYSLIHDDMPCMDDDELRRGQPTCHVKFDEATAMLAGDALQPLAFAQILAAPVDESRRLVMARWLAESSGACGMAGGQAIDLFAVGETLSLDMLSTMHRLKTGALIHASAMMGLTCSSAVDPTCEKAVSDYARALGLAFQVVDDILDVEGTSGELGKSAGKDAAQNKPTFVSLLGLEGAKLMATTLTENALDVLTPLGTRAQVLQGIAEEVLQRKH